MANIKAGQVALLRTTEEPVFVLRVDEDKEECAILSKVLATVRRPIQGEQGVRHSIEQFHIEELETQEDKHTRQISEMEELKARFKPNETFPTQDELCFPN